MIRCHPTLGGNSQASRSGAVLFTVLALLSACMLRADETKTEILASDTKYQGMTLDQWRQRIQDLDPRAPEAAASVDGLLEIIRDPNVPWFTRRQAALTLGRMGATAVKAVPELERFVTGPANEDTLPPYWAMKALALLGPHAASATPAIARLALSPQTPAHLQLLSIEALCRIGITHPQSLPTIITLLQRDQPLITPGRIRSGEELDRIVAEIQCLELFRAAGAEAVPVLLRYSEDREERVRRAVAVTLGAIGPRGIEAAPRLAEMTAADTSLDVRDVAAAALGQVAGTEWLSRLQRSSESTTRERAMVGLGHVPSGDRTARELLQQGSIDTSPQVRIAAIESLHKLTSDATLTAPTAARELSAPDRAVRLRAIRLLTQLGQKASPAREELQKLAAHPDPQVSRAATRLLEGLK